MVRITLYYGMRCKDKTAKQIDGFLKADNGAFCGIDNSGVYVCLWKSESSDHIQLNPEEMRKVERDCIKNLASWNRLCNDLEIDFVSPSWNISWSDL